jgi:hypothetical protein
VIATGSGIVMIVATTTGIGIGIGAGNRSNANARSSVNANSHASARGREIAHIEAIRTAAMADTAAATVATAITAAATVGSPTTKSREATAMGWIEDRKTHGIEGLRILITRAISGAGIPPTEADSFVGTRKVIVSTVVTEGGNSSQRITVRCDLDERTGTERPVRSSFFAALLTRASDSQLTIISG